MKPAPTPIPPFPLNTRTHTHNTPSLIPPPGFILAPPPPALSTARLQACTSLSWWTPVASLHSLSSLLHSAARGTHGKCSSSRIPSHLAVVLIRVRGAQSDACQPRVCVPGLLLTSPPPLTGPSPPGLAQLSTWPATPHPLVSDQVSPLQRSTPPHTPDHSS